MRRLILALVLLGFGFPASGARADTIRLKNGNRFKGTVMQQAEDHVIIEIPDMGKMRFEANEIASVKVDNPPPPAPAPTLETTLGAPTSSSEPLAEEYKDSTQNTDPVFEDTPSAGNTLRECDSRSVAGIFVNLVGEEGLYSAQVSFKDKKYQTCATRGVLLISRETTEYKKDFKQECVTCFAEQVDVPVTKMESVRSINFKPADFETKETGNPYLLVNFRSGQIEEEDFLRFQYRSFEVRKKVP